MVTRVTTAFSYSSAVEVGDYVFIGFHRGFGESLTEQIHSAFNHLQDTLQQLGASLEQVVKINVQLKNIGDLPEMEQVFADYFTDGEFPARMISTTEFIDRNCLLMIDGVAYHPRSRIHKA
ncbi:hypothetical protein GCM10010912_20580 [Paenibacillus albidus]|uniref:RidA family protein n=1 Tax=Paenibacillus albidus TaxID=2041023 RepID=A0A917C743_9BACL|nr:RidA family protein [Paenibacillus albidus]GGF75283.1 hypothetical protein GCM10010912_20580 [Paenibacillus albidus]